MWDFVVYQIPGCWYSSILRYYAQFFLTRFGALFVTDYETDTTSYWRSRQYQYGAVEVQLHYNMSRYGLALPRCLWVQLLRLCAAINLDFR